MSNPLSVAELIEVLKKAPQDAPVMYYWDGSPRSDVRLVYQENGEVILCDERACYERKLPEGSIIYGEDSSGYGDEAPVHNPTEAEMMMIKDAERMKALIGKALITSTPYRIFLNYEA